MLKAMLLVLLQSIKLTGDLHYFEGYDPGAPLNVRIREEQARETYRRIDFVFEGLPGEVVPSLLALPASGSGPFPVLVFLHGIGQEKEFLDEIGPPFAQAGFAFATFDQYMQGERKLRNKAWHEKMAGLYDRGSKTVLEARRLTDYLLSRPDIDKRRVYLIGASYGAMTGAITAAFDTRFKAVSLVYGGGDLRLMAFNPRLVGALGPLAPEVGRWLALFGAVSDPIYYAGQISPRPILFQNGDRDGVVIPASAKALQDAAREPKTVIWYPSDHLDLSPEYIPIAVKDGIEWFKKEDEKVRASSASS